MTRLLLALGIAAALAAAACGGASSAPDGASGDSAAGGSGGGSGTGGAGGATVTTCPATPPATGAACAGTGSCYYQDCAGAGRTLAICRGGTFSVRTAACAAVTCYGMTCTPGQICEQRAGGALLVDCIENTCGTGPVSCDCLQSCFGNCAITGSPETGISIVCNTCPSGQCP